MTVALPAAAAPFRSVWPRLVTTGYFLGNGIAMGTWASNLPRLREVQHLNDASLGLVLLAFGIGAAAMVPFAGTLTARLGAGRAATSGCLLSALLLPLPAVVGPWWLLMAVAAVFGAVNAVVDVSMNAQAALVERRWGAAIMSSFHAGWSGGGLLGAALAGTLAAAGWSLPEAVALPAVLVAALGAIALTAAVHETAPRGPTFALPSRGTPGAGDHRRPELLLRGRGRLRTESGLQHSGSNSPPPAQRGVQRGNCGAGDWSHVTGQSGEKFGASGRVCICIPSWERTRPWRPVPLEPTRWPWRRGGWPAIASFVASAPCAS
jgi:MFS family permease